MTHPLATKQALVQALLAVTLCMTPFALFGEESYLIEHRVIPVGYETEGRFLEFLKYAQPPEGEFQVEDAPHWDIGVFMRYLSDERLVFTDVNDKPRLEAESAAIESSLRARKGRPFEVFSHLSHIYSIPYRQYSELRFSSPAPNTSVVEVSGWYRLTFHKTQQGAKLKQVDYLALEGE